MNLLQLLTFAWVSTWVLCVSLFPEMSYTDKIHTCLFTTVITGYVNNVHGVVWGKMKVWLRR